MNAEQIAKRMEKDLNKGLPPGIRASVTPILPKVTICPKCGFKAITNPFSEGYVCVACGKYVMH